MVQDIKGLIEGKEEKKKAVFSMAKLDEAFVEKVVKKYSKAAGQDRERTKEALTNLINGNIRFVKGTPKPRDFVAETRKTVEEGQKPFAALVVCSDSRSPELAVFDAGVGEIFVIRVAGVVPDKWGLASLEYAVGHLKVPLIGILGHDKCGAVTAAFGGSSEHGHLEGLLDSIKENIKGAKDLQEAIKANTLSVRGSIIAHSDTIAKAYSSGKVVIVPLHYRMADTLEVEIL
ncbi:MAG: carbonic anhydrase [Candidatus Anstonellales archaeon]